MVVGDGPLLTAALVVFNAEDAFVHPSEFHRAEVYIPQPIADLLQTDMLAGKRMSHADPVLLPANAAFATDEPDFKVTGILQGPERARQRAWR